MSKTKSAAERILAELQRRGDRGGLSSEISAGLGCGKSTVLNALAALTKDGRIKRWGDPTPDCLNRKRYWAAEFAPDQAPKRRMREPGLSQDKAKKIALAGKVLRPDAEADLSRAKVTRGPDYTRDPRYQCAPGEQPYGAGFAAVGIGRDVTTGRAWR